MDDAFAAVGGNAGAAAAAAAGKKFFKGKFGGICKIPFSSFRNNYQNTSVNNAISPLL